jgi:hypothetical protein
MRACPTSGEIRSSGGKGSNRDTVERECEVQVLACATGQMMGLEILWSDVCVRGHQESNLKLQSEDRSFANAPTRERLLYYYTPVSYFCYLPVKHFEQPILYCV